MLHDLSLAAERPDGQAAADYFAEAPKVGLHAEPLGRSASAQAETCDHFVKINSAPALLQASRSWGRKSGSGATNPMLAATGSTITAATCSFSSGTSL